MTQDLGAAHRHSINHRQEIEASSLCGCFYCKKIYAPAHIKDWTDDDENDRGTTALCPFCGIDSVIGDSSGYKITLDFLAAMNRRWF